MGANISRSKRRSEFMKLSLPELAGWHLIVTCANCRDRGSGSSGTETAIRIVQVAD